MRTSAYVACSLLVVLVPLASPQQPAPSPPASLVIQVPDLKFVAPDQLGTNATAAEACGTALSATETGRGTFTAPTAPANGSYRVIDPVTITVQYTGLSEAGALPVSPVVSAGFDADVSLFIGPTKVGNHTQTVGPPVTPNAPPKTTHVIRPGANTTGNGSISVQVLLTSSGPTGGLPANAQAISIECGPTSGVARFKIARGPPGAGDLDADGVPDAEDADLDGDGVPNATEAATPCVVNGETVDFASNRAQKEGDHDNDGFTDAEECAKGSDPLDSLDTPPPPKPVPWGRIIFGILVLLLILALVLFILFFGRAAKIEVVSSPELIVPPGESGKYQLVVQNVRKGGSPINFQLSTRGLPEAWDAKLTVDHVVLDPVGGAKNAETVWLTVESPEHPDPESAVVTVRAIALNAAGRKDTFKLPAAAQTITSINVPPNAVVPVKRGAPVKLRSEAETAAAQAPPGAVPGGAGVWREADRPVLDVEGIGDAFAKKLNKVGIATIQQLHAADPATVAKRVGTNETVVGRWQAMAELIDVKGVGPQYAELLVRAGVSSIAQLADADPKGLATKIQEVQEDREVRLQGGPAGVKTVKHWIAAARKHPLSHAPSRPTAEPEAQPTAAPPGKPNLQVGGLAHEPSAFRQGEAVRTSVTVTNPGGDPQKLKLSLFVNDALADAQTVSVKPGKSKEVQFRWTAQERNKLNIRGELVPG